MQCLHLVITDAIYKNLRTTKCSKAYYILRSTIVLQNLADYYKMWRYYIMNYILITLLHNGALLHNVALIRLFINIFSS